MEEKVIELSTLAGDPIKVSIKTILSEWDMEQMENYYLKLMKYDEETGLAKLDVTNSMPDILRKREEAQLEVMVTKIEGSTVDPEQKAIFLKQNLSRREFRKLKAAIEEVLEKEEVPDAKKKN